MATSHPRSLPPPPSTPFLTQKILTLVSSDKNDAGGNSRQRGPLPPSVSPTDSVARAMKNDLEELIDYIDNLAFEQKGGKAVSMKAKTPSTNKQLFPGDDKPSDSNNGDRIGDQDGVFRDRTNAFFRNVGQSKMLDKIRDFEKAKATSLLDSTMTPTKHHQRFEGDNSMEKESKILEPLRNLHMRKEPAGSPPPQEASLYFHDESLSLMLSQSENTDENSMSEQPLNVQRDVDASVRPTRFLSTLQRNGFVSSPERCKSISFLAVSKDPTPSKAMTSTSYDDDKNCAATPNGQVKNNFDSGNEDIAGFHSAQKKIEMRKATPCPREHDVDRFERENLHRKGNEWWRVRSISLDNPSRCDSTGDPYTNESNQGKSLNWEANVTSPLREPHRTSKGAPFSSSQIDESTNAGPNGTKLETPVLHRCKNSNLVLTSPESAKKLLESAIEALQDARKEREEARQWANDIKQSVNEWVEDQRRLIRTESVSKSKNSNPGSAIFLEQRHQVIEDLINELRNEMKFSKSNTESQLQTMMVKQDEQIRDLSSELASVREQLSRVMENYTSKEKGSNSDGRRTNKAGKSKRSNNLDAPGLPHKTPSNEISGLARSASRSETSNVSSRGSHRTRRSTPSGGHLVDYGNGVTKEIHPDGTTVTRFQNGDIETRFGPNSATSLSPSTLCMVAYYHCKEEVLQITQRDGSVLYEYANGQVERHCADGVKIVLFPDGTKTIV